MTERPVWQEFDPSTFTHVARNDGVISWAIDYRERYKFPETKTIWLLGSGVLEPYTIAALPGLERANIIAVDINQDLLGIAESLRDGKEVSWEDIAKVSVNPGRPNADILDKDRLKQYLSVLEQLRSKQNLGDGFNELSVGIPEHVSSRVTFVGQDAQSFLRDHSGEKPDLIGDFFLQVNINKHPEGEIYSSNMIHLALMDLDESGFYIVGDTGKNLPKTLNNFADFKTTGILNLASLVHAVNFGSGYATSHYLIASKENFLPGSFEIYLRVGKRLRGAAFRDFSPREERRSEALLAEDAKMFVNLAYLSPIAWNSLLPHDEALSRVVPQKGDQFSEGTGALPAQKPFLSKRPI